MREPPWRGRQRVKMNMIIIVHRTVPDGCGRSVDGCRPSVWPSSECTPASLCRPDARSAARCDACSSSHSHLIALEKRQSPASIRDERTNCTGADWMSATCHPAAGSGSAYRSVSVIAATPGLLSTTSIAPEGTNPAFGMPSSLPCSSRTEVHVMSGGPGAASSACQLSVVVYPSSRAGTLSARGTLITHTERDGRSGSTETLSKSGDHSVIRRRSA
mmetsp:Transcript_32079/g.102647  ORF Transcript_32079/g.102647 Transcript_32079/m.102647 type:complete len:217 (-) Transcript_32079:278-928(-)